jgi:acyl-CoA reductase-like NAD-dependent aldehyde dehydrogenase
MVAKLLIGGAWRAPLSGRMLDCINPATEEVISTIANGNAADVDAAVGAARLAFPAWKRTSALKRAELLTAIAARITERREELARIEVADKSELQSDDSHTADHDRCKHQTRGHRKSSPSVSSSQHFFGDKVETKAQRKPCLHFGRPNGDV